MKRILSMFYDVIADYFSRHLVLYLTGVQWRKKRSIFKWMLCLGRFPLKWIWSRGNWIELNFQNKFSGALFYNTLINMDLSRREIIIVLLLIQQLKKKKNDCKDKKDFGFDNYTWIGKKKENIIYSSTRWKGWDNLQLTTFHSKLRWFCFESNLFLCIIHLSVCLIN